MVLVLSRLFSLLNWVAFLGWIFVSCSLLFQYQASDETGKIINDLRMTVLALEGICVVEIVRIFFGDLKGNLILGVILHAIRLLTVLETMVRLPNHWTGLFILGSWSVTEVFRYPMYIFPSNAFCRSLRMVVPLVTFPIGAFSEAYGAYIVFFEPESPPGLKVALAAVLFVNGILGPSMAYPALLKKGLPVLGFGKSQKQNNKKIE